jgi:hypothetical protein
VALPLVAVAAVAVAVGLSTKRAEIIAIKTQRPGDGSPAFFVAVTGQRATPLGQLRPSRPRSGARDAPTISSLES